MIKFESNDIKYILDLVLFYKTLLDSNGMLIFQIRKNWNIDESIIKMDNSIIKIDKRIKK